MNPENSIRANAACQQEVQCKMANNLWERLKKVRQLEFSSDCRQIPPSYSARKGVGEVLVKDASSQTITFFEKGRWNAKGAPSLTGFTNVLRWKLDPLTGLLSLEHLRMGVERPVLLFTVEKIGENLYKSLKPHECKEDTYRGSVLFDEHFIQLDWQVLGPKKNERICVVYR